MKKIDFISILMYALSDTLFALGMCMGLIEEWQMLKVGIIVGSLGLLGLVISYLTRRKLLGKAPIRLSVKTVAKVLYAVVALLVFGSSLYLVTSVGVSLLSLGVGLVGLVLLLGLIPFTLGLKA